MYPLGVNKVQKNLHFERVKPQCPNSPSSVFKHTAETKNPLKIKMIHVVLTLIHLVYL